MQLVVSRKKNMNFCKKFRIFNITNAFGNCRFYDIDITIIMMQIKCAIRREYSTISHIRKWNWRDVLLRVNAPSRVHRVGRFRHRYNNGAPETVHNDTLSRTCTMWPYFTKTGGPRLLYSTYASLCVATWLCQSDFWNCSRICMYMTSTLVIWKFKHCSANWTKNIYISTRCKSKSQAK